MHFVPHVTVAASLVRRLEALIAVMQPGTLVAVGRIAETILEGRGAHYVRHPAQSGATAFRQGMRELINSTTLR